jgi:hypothetical protein
MVVGPVRKASALESSLQQAPRPGNFSHPARHTKKAVPLSRRVLVKFATEVLSLLAFLLGTPVDLPRLVEASPVPNAAPADANHQSAPSSSLPPSK